MLPTTGTVILVIHVKAQADTGQGISKLLRCRVSWFNFVQVLGKHEGIIAKEYTPASEVVLSKRYLCGILVVKLRRARGNTGSFAQPLSWYQSRFHDWGTWASSTALELEELL